MDNLNVYKNMEDNTSEKFVGEDFGFIKEDGEYSNLKSPIGILKEIKKDSNLVELGDHINNLYYLVDTKDRNKVYVFYTQNQIVEFTESKCAGIKQPNISTHKDTGTLSKSRWLIFTNKCVNGKKIFKFRWQKKKFKNNYSNNIDFE